MNSQEICDRSSNSTEGDRLPRICDRSFNSTGGDKFQARLVIKIQDIHRIGHVNLLRLYVRKSKDAQIVAGFTFSHFFKKCHQNVFKTCQK